MLHMSRYTFTRALYAAVIPAANGGAQDVNPTVQAGVGPSRTLCYLLSGGTSVKVEWDPKKARGTAERRDPLRAPYTSGRPHPRYGNERDPDHVLDVQIAVYGMVAQQLAAQWKLPNDVGVAYAYPDTRGENERSFRDDFSDLEAAARGWLETTAGLLTERSFPRTPVADDCRYCPFQVVCGQHAPERAARLLEAASGSLASFRSIKVAENK